jgi:hypothetical protein
MATISETRRLPAGPLVAMIDRMLLRASEGLSPSDHTDDRGARAAVYERLGTSSRRVYEWRRPRAQVQADVADRVLSASPYLWFDIWTECPLGVEHDAAVALGGTCPRCDAHSGRNWRSRVSVPLGSVRERAA